jgi:hypothetical protein
MKKITGVIFYVEMELTVNVKFQKLLSKELLLYINYIDIIKVK